MKFCNGINTNEYSQLMIQLPGNNKLMKTLEANKNIQPSERKPTRKFKPLPHIVQSQAISFQAPQELILKTQILPVNIELQTFLIKDIVLSLTSFNASLKYENQTCSIPLHLGKSRWLRIALGQQIRKIQLRAPYNQNNTQKPQLFTDIDQWKAATAEDPALINHFLLQSMLKLLKSKLITKDKNSDKMFRDQSQLPPKDKKGSLPQKGSLGSFIKTRMSERHTFRANVVQFRSRNDILSQKNQGKQQKNSSLQTLDKRQNNTIHHRIEARKASITLEPQKIISCHNLTSQMKESNTSTSIGYQHEIKIPKRMRRIRDAVESKALKSHLDGTLEDMSELFPLKQQRPRFYQHINMSQEQIDLKRKKFDSQFICKKSTLPQTTKQIAPQRNDSEVTEDIIKIENSQGLQCLDDTLQKGFMQNNAKTNKEIQESGSLYESVYE